MLAREGAHVVVTDINIEGAAKVAEAINATSKGAAIALSHDVTKEDDWLRVLKETEKAFGGLHVLVNNAGIGLTKDLEQITLEEWRHVHAIDLDGVFLGCKNAIAPMAKSVKASGLGGSIVNISSISGIIAGHNMAAYNSAKAAVRHLSKSVALYCARKGFNIRSNSVHPVFIATPILDPLVQRFGKEEAYASWRVRCRSAPSRAPTTSPMRCCISPRRIEIRHRRGTESGRRHFRDVRRCIEGVAMSLRLWIGTGLLTFGLGSDAALAGDKPGTAYHISASSLPAPYATPGVSNWSDDADRPDGALPWCRGGLRRRSSPRVKRSALDDGGAQWRRLPGGGDGPARSRCCMTARLRPSRRISIYPHGLALHDGALYVGDKNAVWRLAYSDGALKAGARTRVTKDSVGGKSGHITRDIAFGPDGTLYVAIGSANNVAEEKAPRASVQRVTADGRLTTFASGLRNPVGIVFYPGTDDLYVTVNERDGYGDGLVPDYLTRIRQGDFFGWPYAYIGRHPESRFRRQGAPIWWT